MYPDEGELFKAKEKKSDHLIFFVHFFKGQKKNLRRHIELVNELGYDAYAFNLRTDFSDHYYVPYSETSEKFGMKHALADQIEDNLDELPEYKTKIMFAFSNVAGSAIEVMARRHEKDIVALVCDSGPGSAFVYSSYKLAQEQLKIKFLPFKLLATPLIMVGWSKGMNKDIPEDLRKLPEGFPVLSIRGWKDKLISPSHIDKIFEPCRNLRWTKLSLPEAGHLTGLRDFPNEYRAGLTSFLAGLD
jgi:pimeloyl-ACP methyl ester carboxylesterase